MHPPAQPAPGQGGGQQVAGGHWVSHWVSEYKNLGANIKRIDTGDGDYTPDIEESEDVSGVSAKINECIAANAVTCREFQV